MSSHTGESTGSGIRGAASAVHGLGETIRGTINTAADSAVGSDASKNQAIRDRGVDEINTGRYHGTGAGVTPADTAAERHNRAAQGEYPSTASTGLGGSTHNPTTTTHTGAYDTAGTTGYGNPHSTNAGPHGSNVANKADPRVDSDLDSHRNTTGAGYGNTTAGTGYGNTTTGTGYGNTTGTGYGNTSTTGSTQYDDPRSSNLGPHSSNVANKADPRVDSDFDNRARTGNQTGAAAGPHGSNVANKADPRVDSDRDHRRGSAATAGLQPTGGLSGTTSRQDLEGIDPTEIKGGYTTAETTTGHSGHGGSSGLSGVHESHVGNNPSSNNHGPHGSKIANKLDPRVDSDVDNRARTGNQTGAAAGPHSSNLANKADPRVDSDLDNRAHRGTGTTTTGTTTGHTDTYGSTGTTGAYGSTGSTGYGNTSTNHGTHDSNLANKADPRFDSDLDNRARTGNQTGAAAGPHGSNVANKADPRVDSDRDNRAHHGTTTGTGYTDTTSKHDRSDSATHADESHGSHPSHGTGLVGKVLDKVDPRVKNA